MTYYGNMRRISNTGRNIAGDKLYSSIDTIEELYKKKNHIFEQ